MRKKQIVELERHRLSDGGLAMVKRFGRTYSFTRTYPSPDQAPTCVLSVKKDEAYRLLADVLRRDVLELD